MDGPLRNTCGSFCRGGISRPRASHLLLVCLLGLVALVSLAGTAHAATFTVQNLADDAPFSLRAAIAAANASAGADDIRFLSLIHI